MESLTVLVVEDDENYRYEIAQELEPSVGDVKFFYAGSRKEAQKLFLEHNPSLILLDIIFPETENGRVDYLSGVKFLDWLKEQNFLGGILVLSSQDKTFAVDLLVRYRHVRDYIFKDSSWIEIVSRVKRHLEDIADRVGLLKEISRVHPVIGNSEIMRRVKSMAQKVSVMDTGVLIMGESGVGKEVLARSIHAQSPRRSRSFITVNCAAVPEGLFESHFFGHKKGAFTGAVMDQDGYVKAAQGGTLFLDEVGEIPLSMQVKLLRLLQEKTFVMVGDHREQEADVRVIAATNCDLKQAVEQKKFREDLYYRLNVVPIFIPPLRERMEDLPELVENFLRQAVETTGIQKGMDSDSIHLLSTWNWPGNVRELKNSLERLLILSEKDPIGVEDVKMILQNFGAEPVQVLFPLHETDYHGMKQKVMDSFHRRFFLHHLRVYGNSIRKTAEATGYNRNDLSLIVKKLGLKSDD
ncbi:MAG: sigma-54-dependent Fis family transcriptional regulator [Candidatus Cloacimonetes bacterium]|nr:sigma-54-dependent Fis family transcriptional regulator [Candidatus Cloacimonadota bacterium]